MLYILRAHEFRSTTLAPGPDQEETTLAHRIVAAALGALLLLTAAACGDDNDNKSDSGSGTTAPANDAALGTPKKATGTPVTIGLIGDGKSEAIDNTPEIAAAKAAAQYVNEYLGGVAGHPITLKVCETHQTPSGATDCGTEMANAKVPVVLNGVSGQANSFFKALQPTGIPIVQAGGLDEDMVGMPGAFILTNGLGSAIAGPAGIARDNNVKKAGILVIDVPAASGPLKAAAPLFYKNADVTPDVIAVPTGTADMTPQIQAGISNGDGQFAIVGDAAFCTSAIKALRTVGFKGPVVVIPQCVDSSSGSATNGGFEGAYVLTAGTTEKSDPDVQTYDAVMAKYAKGSETGGVAPGGYTVVVAFARAMARLTGEMTPESVTATLKAMPETPLPMGKGITFKCDGKQISIAPNICSTKVLEATLDGDGNPKSYKLFETADLLKVGG